MGACQRNGLKIQYALYTEKFHSHRDCSNEAQNVAWLFHRYYISSIEASGIELQEQHASTCCTCACTCDTPASHMPENRSLTCGMGTSCHQPHISSNLLFVKHVSLPKWIALRWPLPLTSSLTFCSLLPACALPACPCGVSCKSCERCKCHLLLAS